MIVLNQTTDNLQVSLGSTPSVPIPVVSSWRDRTSSTFTAGKSVSQIENTSDVNAITGPSFSGSQRIIDYINIYNTDSSALTITVKLDTGSDEYIIYKGSISPGQTVQYVENKGFFVLDYSGAKLTTVEQSGYSAGSPWTDMVLQNDTLPITGPSGPYYPITGLSFFGETGGSYYFSAKIFLTGNTTSAGINLSVTGPPGPTFVGYYVEVPGASTSEATFNIYGATYGVPDAFTPGSATRNTSLYYTFGTMGMVEGIISIGQTGGDVIPMISIVTTTNTRSIVVKSGSVIQYHKIA